MIRYCSGCRESRRFLDLGAYLVCERCNKRLETLLPCSWCDGAGFRSLLTASYGTIILSCSRCGGTGKVK